MAKIRAAVPPSRNWLSHANRMHDPKIAEDLFWSMIEHFETLHLGEFHGHSRRVIEWQLWTALRM